MAMWVGTSGYNYPEWRGSFYPEKFPTNKMLAYYAERFNTVEVNYTFYRMPTETLLGGWASGTPEGFTFTLKAPRRITHDSKLQRCEELTEAFCRIASTLGPKLGVLLFQLPPNFKRNDAVLAAFLGTLPHGARAAFEFRHESWHDETVFADDILCNIVKTNRLRSQGASFALWWTDGTCSRCNYPVDVYIDTRDIVDWNTKGAMVTVTVQSDTIRKEAFVRTLQIRETDIYKLSRGRGLIRILNAFGINPGAGVIFEPGSHTINVTLKTENETYTGTTSFAIDGGPVCPPGR